MCNHMIFKVVFQLETFVTPGTGVLSDLRVTLIVNTEPMLVGEHFSTYLTAGRWMTHVCWIGHRGMP